MRAPAAVLAACTGALLASASPAAATMELNCTMAGHMDVYATPMLYIPTQGQWAMQSHTAACSGTQDSEPVAGIANIYGRGTFSSITCGTGTFTGGMTVSTTPATPLDWPVFAQGGVQFTVVGGSGPFSGFLTASGPAGIDSGTVAGWIMLTPNNDALATTHGGSPNHQQPPTSLTNTCADEYAVDLSFTLTSTDD